MIGSHNAKGVLGNVDGQLNIILGNRGIHKVIVVRRQEQPAADALGNPLLVEHQAFIVGNAQIEQRRLAGHHQVKAVLLTGSYKAC